jgi:16S rRNA (adenine1518-N6/adenine1519-N6)-dimethyltransferase
MRLSEMKQLLALHGLRLTKSLGQNFLHDANQLRRIVDAAELCRGDKVLEIGPGLGPLTELLLENAGEVMAIEKDARLVELLDKSLAARPTRTAFGHRASFSLLHGDALKFLERQRRDWSQWKMVSNLPYSVASPILVELALAGHGPERMVATLQIEVARRLMAASGDKDYGVLTLLVQLHYEPKHFFKIPAACFFPEPEVDSACVCLLRRPEQVLNTAQQAIYVKLVKRSFSQRRKMMLKLLREDWPAEALSRAFDELNIPHESRAEEVGREGFEGLAKVLGTVNVKELER